MHEKQQIATEVRGMAAHIHHGAAARHGKEDHLTGHESSRQELEHANRAYLHLDQEHAAEHSDHVTGEWKHDDIAALAYQIWQSRGCPHGSPEEDWFRAIAELRLRS